MPHGRRFSPEHVSHFSFRPRGGHCFWSRLGSGIPHVRAASGRADSDSCPPRPARTPADSGPGSPAKARAEPPAETLCHFHVTVGALNPCRQVSATDSPQARLGKRLPLAGAGPGTGAGFGARHRRWPRLGTTPGRCLRSRPGDRRHGERRAKPRARMTHVRQTTRRLGGGQPAPTIYDVARAAGRIHRVGLPGAERRTATRARRPGTGCCRPWPSSASCPDGAARALSARLKEVVGVVVPAAVASAGPARTLFADEDGQPAVPRHDQPGHRGRRPAARLRPADQVGRTWTSTIRAAGSSRWPARATGIILHDRVLTPASWTGWPGRSRWSRWPGRATLTAPTCAATTRPGCATWPGTCSHDHGYRTHRLPRRARRQPGQPSPGSGVRWPPRRGREGGSCVAGPRLAGQLPAVGGARVINRLLDRGPPTAARHRVRERPDRARRDVRAGPARHRRPRRRGRHRLRRHADGPAPAAAADHGSPADQRARGHSVRACCIP